ncbi:MAG: kelch repeat-containing protein, partial [Planctomycetota bacterium]
MHASTKLCLLSALVAPALAQNDFALDKVTTGRLGSNLQLRVIGAPANAGMFVMLSQNAGPTAIASIDPLDTRSVEVGLDLFANWFFTFTDALGAAAPSVFVPNDVAFQGLTLHWQTFTFPGALTTIGQISNDVVTQCGSSGSTTTAPSVLLVPRAFGTAFVNSQLNAGQGDVVIAGGGGGTLTSSTGLATSEIFDFRELSVRPGPTMSSSRALHQAIPLLDGRVLMIGGVDALGGVLATCELYNPATNTFTPTGSMGTARALHAAVRLGDGRVLCAGGTSSMLDAISLVTNVRNSTEIYNPATGTWSGSANLSGFRLLPSLSLLPNGRALAAGGLEVTFFLGFPLSAGTTATCQTYNPATNSWAAAAALPSARTGHQYNQVQLANGRVLMTGGLSVTVNITSQTLTTTPLNNACYYDQPSNTWT